MGEPYGTPRSIMSLETAQHIFQLNPSYPSATDRVRDGDDHLRQIKACLVRDLGSLNGELTVTAAFLNGLAAALEPVGVIKAWYGAAGSVPARYAICDGSQVNLTDGSGKITTPDLRGRTIVGVSGDYAQGSTFGQTVHQVTSDAAGDHGHQLTLQSAGSHSHGGQTQGHALTIGETPAHSHYEFAIANNGYANLAQYPEGAPNSDASGGSSGASYDIGGGGQPATAGRSSSVGGNQAHSHGIDPDGDHTHSASLASAGAHSHSLSIDVTQPSLALHWIMRI